MNPVTISPRKNGELQSNIARIKHPVRERKVKYDDYLAELKLDHLRHPDHFVKPGRVIKPKPFNLYPSEYSSENPKHSPLDSKRNSNILNPS